MTSARCAPTAILTPISAVRCQRQGQQKDANHSFHYRPQSAEIKVPWLAYGALGALGALGA